MAALYDQRAIAGYLCEMRGVHVNAVQAGEGDWQVAGFRNITSRMTPLSSAIERSHEDLALYLLSLPDQELDLNRSLGEDASLLHICAKLGSTRVAKELVRRGADMDVKDSEHHTPLCTAAIRAHLPLVRYFLQQYQRRGQSELERALSHPCLEEGLDYSVLIHVIGACLPNSEPHVAVARYLVRECTQLWLSC